MKQYISSESGAVTVDWAVLTAGLVGLGLATMSVVSTGVQDTSGDVESQLTERHIYTSFNSRNHSAYYEALLALDALVGEGWFTSDGVTPITVDQYFEDKLAAMHAMSDTDLVASIQQMQAITPVLQANIDAYSAVDASDLNAVAAIEGADAAALQTHIDDNYNGDVDAWLAVRIAFEQQKFPREEARQQIADERGLTY